jgi:hypothetical protein
MRTRPYVKDCCSYRHTLTYNHTNILETGDDRKYIPPLVQAWTDGRLGGRFFGLFPNRSRGRRRRTAGNFKGILPFLSISRKRGWKIIWPWRRDRFWPRAISVRPTANHTPIHEARGGICPGTFFVMGVTCVMHYTHPGIIVTRSFW